MKKTLILFLLACCLTNATFAQYGFVAVAHDDGATRSSASVGQQFTHGVSVDGNYANEGLQQPFLYRNAEDTLLYKNSSYPVDYRPAERNPEGIVYQVPVGLTPLLYLLPTRGIDTLVNVMAYGVTGSNDTTVVAPYGVCDYDFGLPRPLVLPAGSVPPVHYDNDRPGTYPVGTVVPVEWTFGVADKTLTDTQLVNVKFPPCGNDNFLTYTPEATEYPFVQPLESPYMATDFEGNSYNTVRIDCHCWTAENLKSTKYADGESIPNPMAYVSYEHPDEAANVERYGYLYAWDDAVRAPLAPDTDGYVRGVCPDGWHLPTGDEFASLDGHSSFDLMATSDWLIGGGTNITGFNALPAGKHTGYRFENLLGETHFWSATSVTASVARYCSLLFGCKDVLQFEVNTANAMSIRCLKD